MNKYPDFWHVIFGGGPSGYFLAYIVLAYVGAIGMILIQVANRDQDSPNTPKQWSWRFFWANNALRFVAGFFLIPLFIRLVYQEVNPNWMVGLSIGIGFGFQGLAYLAKNFGLLTTNAISQRIADKLAQKQTNDNQPTEAPKS